MQFKVKLRLFSNHMMSPQQGSKPKQWCPSPPANALLPVPPFSTSVPIAASNESPALWVHPSPGDAPPPLKVHPRPASAPLPCQSTAALPVHPYHASAPCPAIAPLPCHCTPLLPVHPSSASEPLPC